MKWLGFLLIVIQSSCTPVFAQKTETSTFFSDLEKISEGSLTLQNEKSRLESLNTLLFSKKMGWTPTASVSLGRGHSSLTGGIQDSWKGDLTWNLFKGGANYQDYRAADESLKAQQLKFVSERLKLESAAAELIFRYLYSLDVLKFTRELVKLREESHRIVVEKYKQGQVPLQEVVKSEVDKSQQETRLRSLEAENLQIQSQWKALLSASIQTQNWPFSPNVQVADRTSELSPGTRRLEHLSRAAESQWRASRGAYWPSLDFTASYGELLQSNVTSKQWSTGLVLTLPLWDQYQTAATAATNYNSYVTAKNEYELNRRSENAQREVLAKRLSIHSQNLLDAKANLDKSQKLYKDMLKSFRYGRMSVNDLLTEQDRLIQSEITLSESQLTFHKMLMESCGVSGLPVAQCLK